jgi:alpha-L-rhamnosidase
MTWVKGCYDSIRGRIISEWKRDGSRLILNVTIPPNTSATVFVPARHAEDVNEGSGPAAKASGVQFVCMENSRAVYQIGSGVYQFSTTGFTCGDRGSNK